MKRSYHLSDLQFLVQNIPISWEELKAVLEAEIKDAKQNNEVRYLCYAGPYDILVHPSGHFQLIPYFQLRVYKLVGNCYEEVD